MTDRVVPALLMVLAALVSAPMAWAQSSPLSAAQLHATVDVDAKGVFVYRYTVENGARSTAGIFRMTVDISLRAGAQKPSATGLVPGPGYSAGSSVLSRSVLAKEAVPVGLSAPQPGWTVTVGTDGAARWVTMHDRSFVSPARRLGGFSLASHGPPSLRRFVLSPHIDPDRAPIMAQGEDPGEADRYNQDLEEYVDSQSVAGTTLGPGAPVTLTADAVLANLADQVVQARSLGWISNDVMGRSVRTQLNAARAALSRRQLDAAGSVLQSLRHEVAAQSGRSLTSEAVALVDLNIQYALRLAAGR